jgi:CheY-like chemotaxis protein
MKEDRHTKILAIEDSHTLRRLIELTFEHHAHHYKVWITPTGQEGITTARKVLPDLILADCLMPDLDASHLCNQLVADPRTAAIPVILMSSDLRNLHRIQKNHANVIQILSKPFSSDSLFNLVKKVCLPSPRKRGPNKTLKIPSAKKRAAADCPEILIRGNTSHHPLPGVLNYLEDSKATGALSLQAKGETILVFFSLGKPLLVTSQNVDWYLGDQPLDIPLKTYTHLEKSKKRQRQTGCPVFLTLSERQSLHPKDSLTLMAQYGQKLFAKIWTIDRVRYEFIQLKTLPNFTDHIPPFPGNLNEWAMDTLRQTDDTVILTYSWGEPEGVATFTRAGYERVQRMKLQTDERTFATLCSNTYTLRQVADQMKLSSLEIRRLLFRFICLDILDYWPPNLLIKNHSSQSSEPTEGSLPPFVTQPTS